jgi:ParB family chromosome partitioning protein
MEGANNMNEIIKELTPSELSAFPTNPYQVSHNEEFNALVESIKTYGIISPIIARPKPDDGYEIISGHRRIAACKEAGIEKIPAFIRDMDNDTAVIALVDSNLHRENILPSEKAFAYKMKLDAIKHQGKRTDLTSAQVVPKLSAREIVAESLGVNRMEISRYVRLTYLIPELLKLVDNKIIAFNPAVELSYLAENAQKDLLETIESEDCTPSLSQALRMKGLSLQGRLSMDAIFAVMTEPKPNQMEHIKFPVDSLKKYFPKDYTTKQIENTIMQLVENWQKQQERKKHDMGAR